MQSRTIFVVRMFELDNYRIGPALQRPRWQRQEKSIVIDPNRVAVDQNPLHAPAAEVDVQIGRRIREFESDRYLSAEPLCAAVYVDVQIVLDTGDPGLTRVRLLPVQRIGDISRRRGLCGIAAPVISAIRLTGYQQARDHDGRQNPTNA